MWSDYLKLALDGIANRKVRSWLTMVGVFIGIIAVVTLISLGQGLQKYIDRQFEAIGGDRIIVTPGGGGFQSGPPGGTLTSAKLHESDVDVVKRVRGVDMALGIIFVTADIEYNNKKKFGSVVGISTDPEYLPFLRDSDFSKVEKGGYLKKSDRYKAIIGPNVGEGLFKKDIRLGSKIKINDVEFDVVGINKDTGDPFTASRIIIPLDTAKDLFNKTDEYSMISVKVKKGSEPSDVAEKIKDRLRQHRHVKEKEEDFSVQTSENIVASFKIVLNIVTLVLSGIAAISLIVGGIGIMTTMYTSVIERTRQIGIMKSIGARNSDILLIFIAESGLLGLVGGIIGVILGLIASLIAENVVRSYGIKDFAIYAGPDLILGALAFSFLVGCISGYMPAIRAANMKPVDALRYR